jgi:hypothetical protein
MLDVSMLEEDVITLDDESIALVTDTDVLAEDDAFEADTSCVEELCDDEAEETNVEAFVRLAELDREALVLDPADPDVMLAASEVDEAMPEGLESSALLEAVD